ncbi:hypothetical protein JW906_04645 [bacterium]|nr:hypothetical protein [bacterium]
MRLKKYYKIIILVILQSAPNVWADFASYASNPFVFSHTGEDEDPVDSWKGGNIQTADLTLDGNPDFILRSNIKIYAYDHDGSLLWDIAIGYSGYDYNKGATYGVTSDLNGDHIPDLVAVNASVDDEVWVISGADGTLLGDPIEVPLETGQIVGHVAVVNLRGEGDRDLIVQTIDVVHENTEGSLPPNTDKTYYYMNRTLLSYNLETRSQLWDPTVNQNRSIVKPFYEGYWGQAHGPLICADVDWDGLDEVVGGTFIDPVSPTNPGTPTQIISESWLGRYIGLTPSVNYVDHLDAILVGDFRPDIPGLEWLIAQEDDMGYMNMHTGMYSKSQTGYTIWSLEALDLLGLSPDFTGGTLHQYIEPQFVAVGNFDLTSPYYETWNGSRQGNLNVSTTQSQHPWVYSGNGVLFAHYSMSNMLPAGFNPVSNLEGVEAGVTIDWDGTERDYVAVRSRYRSSFAPTVRHVGIFNGVTFDSIWTTLAFEDLYASQVFVSDVCGDSREEIICYDKNDHTVKVFWNESANPSPGANKWLDPLYRRVKQTWNFYSTGGYTRPASVPLLQVAAMLEGPYNASGHNMYNSLQTPTVYIPHLSPYDEDPRTAYQFPANTVDWILVQVCAQADTHVVFNRSAFLLTDGSIVEDENVDGINLYSLASGDYFLVLRHRNHLAVISAATVSVSSGSTIPYDFSTAESQAGGTGALKQLESGVWGLWAGDADGSGQVGASDRNETWNKRTQFGYLDADCDLSGYVLASDRNITWNNRTKSSELL